MANPLHPDLMTSDERLAEIGAILAIGFLRLRLRQQQQSGPAFAEKNSLDFLGGRSVHATTPKRRRVA